jgi:DNA-binding transcriptional ArsR family regulator
LNPRPLTCKAGRLFCLDPGGLAADILGCHKSTGWQYIRIDKYKWRLYYDGVQAFAALADPTRRRMVELLADGERSAGDLAKRFTLTQPAISQHLRALRDAGMVRVRRDAQRRMYSIDGRGLAQIEAWLSRYRTFWTTHLDALERALHDEDDES